MGWRSNHRPHHNTSRDPGGRGVATRPDYQPDLRPFALLKLLAEHAPTTPVIRTKPGFAVQSGSQPAQADQVTTAPSMPSPTKADDRYGPLSHQAIVPSRSSPLTMAMAFMAWSWRPKPHESMLTQNAPPNGQQGLTPVKQQPPKNPQPAEDVAQVGVARRLRYPRSDHRP